MLKSYDELRKIDVSPYLEERDGMKYLNWAMCIDLLHKNGAETVHWEPIPNEKTGGSLYYTDVVFKDKSGVENRCYETRIRVPLWLTTWQAAHLHRGSRSTATRTITPTKRAKAYKRKKGGFTTWHRKQEL